MRFLTTLILLAAAVGGGAYWYLQTLRVGSGAAIDAPTMEVARLTPSDLVRIEVNDARLEKAGKVWTLPGEWPTRTAEVNSLVETLTSLQSRFTPVPFTNPEDFGFDAEQKPVVIKTTLRSSANVEKTLTLTFGEPTASAGNPFVRPTYLRIDDQKEVLRLAPGVLPMVRETRIDFLRKQLFPDVVRTKVGDGRTSMGGDNDLPTPPVPLLDAAELVVTSPDGAFTLKHIGPPTPKNTSGVPVALAPEKLAESWELAAPVTDRPDPEKLRTILASVPDLWVEAFLTESDLAKAGLDNPERTVSVKSADHELKLLIGKVSRVKETKPPPPPPPNPFNPPPPPPPVQREEFRYAKLPNNPQVFEVRSDKFADLFVKPADLRDPKIARFKSSDVKKVELVAKDTKLTFAKEKEAGGDEKWRMLEPAPAAAEGPRVTELIDRLEGLQAKGPDVIDTTELKQYGLAEGDPATTITLTINEERPGPTAEAPKTTATRTLTYRLGKDDVVKTKLYVQLAGQPRVNAVADDLLKIVDRPALAYRSRRVIDFAQNKLTKIAVERPTDNYSLTQADGVWSLAAPVVTKADAGKASALAGDLSRLEAADFVNFAPTPEDLKSYGLDAPTLKATLDASDGPKTLLFGKPREGKPEVYAKLADAPAVFAVRATVKDAVDQPSLAFRPLQLWMAQGPVVTKMAMEHGADKCELTRESAVWKITVPFNAAAFLSSVQPLLDAASSPRAEKFVDHTSDKLAEYGLDKPSATLKVTLTAEKPEDPSGVREIIFGKAVTEGQPSRYARLADQPGVFVMNAANIVDKSALDLLDRRMLSIDTRQVNRVEGTGPGGAWSAKLEGNGWTLDSFTPPVNGDRMVLDRIVSAFADVRATQFAAYSPTDIAQFGLDKPFATVKVTQATGDKPITHIIALGNPSPSNAQARYARVDDGPAIAILPVGVSLQLGVSSLELADRSVLKFDSNMLTAIHRTMGSDEFVLEKKDNIWQEVKPKAGTADESAVAEMAERLGTLRGVKVAALGVKDFKPFGLEPPAATFTLTLKEPDGKNKDVVLHLGNATPEGRPARVGTGDTVYLLPDSAGDPLATRLTAAPIKFRERALTHFTDADRVTIKRGERTVTFAKVDGAWKMTAPITADAEALDLDDVVLAASRLRADELLADEKGDLKPFGLDKPEELLMFFQGDKEVLKLSVSAKDKDGRVAVMAGDGPVVGRLDAGLSNRLLNEFRKRALWNNLDAAQVDTLIINAGAGGPPFMLNKNEAGWMIADKPEQVVNPEAISDLLATFAGLKAERYVADQKADLKLYGLEKPVRVIVVKLKSGQTSTLHLGHYEGDSKRAYATVPGAGTAVVLSEADTAKLMKPVTEFTRK